jgi:hypothetical protein
LPGRFLHDVPVGGAVLEHPEREARTVELHGANDDGLTAPEIPHHAPEVEDHREAPDTGEGVAREPAGPRDREVVESHREVREVAEKGETGVAPVDARVHGAIDLRLHPRDEPVAKEEWQRDQRDEGERQDGSDHDE